MNARISRILLVSPEKNETIRRNRSRIFVWPKGETAIDAMIFQAHRPIDQFRDLAGRAILMSGLAIHQQETLELDIVETKTTTGMQQHFATRGWCHNEDGKVFDIIIEATFGNESVPTVDVNTLDPVLDGIETGENPLIIEADVYNLSAQQEEPSGDAEEANVVEVDFKGKVDNSASTNEEPAEETKAARRSDDSEDGDGNETTEGRMKGKPGRVKNPWDMRLKANRTK